LYNCGKVCLSLLGTWSGDQGESWNPQLSTFLQVLISIQSLILVEQPYFNEPGWERQMHTERGKKASFDYNDERRYQTIRVAMVDMIKNPPESYETFIKEHFMHKKEEIFSKIELWINESTKYKNKMIEQYKELKTLL
jgi:baculoviral IAP repeat-containing protein 6 (apollon)